LHNDEYSWIKNKDRDKKIKDPTNMDLWIVIIFEVFPFYGYFIPFYGYLLR